MKILFLVCGLAMQGTDLIAGPVLGKMAKNFNEYGVEAALFTVVLYSLNYSLDKIDGHVGNIYLSRKKQKLGAAEKLPDLCHEIAHREKQIFIESFKLTPEEELQIQKSSLKRTDFDFSLTTLELQKMNEMPALEEYVPKPKWKSEREKIISHVILSPEDQEAVDSVNAWSQSFNIYGRKEMIEDCKKVRGDGQLPDVRYS